LNTITGTEMLESLKKIRNFNIPVILLSKDNKYEYNEEYLKMGFSDIIIKPIKKEELLEKIDKNIIKREDIFKDK
jgi:CheY-like chemotaxis protein